MWISLIGSLLGFGASLAPQLMKYFQDGRDKAHELAVMNLQLEAQRQGHFQKLEEINAMADIEESKALYQASEIKMSGVKWLDALSGIYNQSVRPTITYCFAGLYIWVKVSLMHKGFDIIQVWNETDMAIFCTILSYWFGQRAMRHFFGK